MHRYRVRQPSDLSQKSGWQLEFPLVRCYPANYLEAFGPGLAARLTRCS